MKNHREIFEALLAGKKIRCKGWDKGSFIFVDSNGDIVNERFVKVELYLSFSPSAWEIYEPPKEKVKLYQYAFKTKDGPWTLTGFLYTDDSHFKSSNPASSENNEFKRLDHTCIEVER